PKQDGHELAGSRAGSGGPTLATPTAKARTGWRTKSYAKAPPQTWPMKRRQLETETKTCSLFASSALMASSATSSPTGPRAPVAVLDLVLAEAPPDSPYLII